MYIYKVRPEGLMESTIETHHKVSPIKAASLAVERNPRSVFPFLPKNMDKVIGVLEIDGGMETTSRLKVSELAHFMGVSLLSEAQPYVREGGTQDLIGKKCDQVKTLLLKKNADYGNSALKPTRIFSKADSTEQIRVRIDDKLSRIAGGGEKNFTEDTVMDLVGYLILLMVKMEEEE